MTLVSSRIDCGSVALQTYRCGVGMPVLFLHGFPEIARFWAPLMQQLVADVDAIAPDQRGCGASARPADRDDYGVAALLQDLIALLDALAVPRCHVVGHDWGGVLAWWLAARHPERVNKLAVFNAPHPAALQWRLARDARQQEASAYFERLRQPGAAAALLAAGPRALWDRLRGDDASFDDETRQAYLATWSAPDALEGPLAWYRCSPFALGGSPSLAGDLGQRLQIAAPTLIVWGLRDKTFVPELIADSAAYAADVRIERFADAAHNVPREQTAASASLLRRFFFEPGRETRY